MLSKWPIKVKFLIGLGLLLSLVVVLSSSGLHATYAYRGLVRGIGYRADELPLAAELSQQVADLRITVGELRGLRAQSLLDATPNRVPIRGWMVHDRFSLGLSDVEATLGQYRGLLERKSRDGSPIADNQREWDTARRIEAALVRVRQANLEGDWFSNGLKLDQLDAELEHLQELTVELPSYLHHKLDALATEVRNRYRLMIVGTWVVSVLAGLIFALFLRLFYRWVFRPLRTLIDGSRRVAAGEFAYRISLASDDEMAELAGAMNQMTERFQAIRDDLDRQVQDRTRQVVRAEQLASVGFLAAGVAHEINNPLASIALCAESLEGRIREALDPAHADHEVIAHYLRMIQDEAFRCKGITEKLLDFSRMGPVERQSTDLGELVAGVVEMVRHLGKYQQMRVDLAADEAVVAPVNPQETKQVVLNLLTNSLDSLEPGGTVRIGVSARGGYAEIAVADDGCGMEPEVLRHVFEPFFTRRRKGQGTGLGLSITSRIVSDHGGEIDAHSDGPGRGSTFRVRLPLAQNAKEASYQPRAA